MICYKKKKKKNIKIKYLASFFESGIIRGDEMKTAHDVNIRCQSPESICERFRARFAERIKEIERVLVAGRCPIAGAFYFPDEYNVVSDEARERKKYFIQLIIYL